MRLMLVCKPDRKKILTLTGLFLAAGLLLLLFTSPKLPASEEAIYTLSSDSDVFVEEKIAYLTFDDGPSSITGGLLDILKQKQVAATFFVVGEGNDISTDERDILWKRMADEGHLIGLHVWEHCDYHQIYASAESYLSSLGRLEDEIDQVTGREPRVYRFPAGSNNAYCSLDEYRAITDEMTAEGYIYVDWNVDGQDAIGINRTADAVASHVIREAKKQVTPVILLHDIPSCKGSVQAVSRIIDALWAAGYRFDTLDHLKVEVHQNIKGLK